MQIIDWSDESGLAGLEIKIIEDRIAELKAALRKVPFFDNVDLRYNHFVKEPKPITNAVVFMLMDVSGSMGEREKTISKKFFILFNLFLRKRYKKTEVVFIRHHGTARECDEKAFFMDTDSGGTVVSTGYEVIRDVIKERYPPDTWNIYIAQASDGDNYSGDNEPARQILEELLVISQFFIYLEIGNPYRMTFNGMGMSVDDNQYESTLWPLMKYIETKYKNSAARQVANEDQILGMFREIFKKANAS